MREGISDPKDYKITSQGNYRNVQPIKKQGVRLMMVDPEGEKESDVEKTNHVLTIVLVVVLVLIVIVSGLIFMIMNGEKEIAERRKQAALAKQYGQDTNIEFGPLKSEDGGTSRRKGDEESQPRQIEQKPRFTFYKGYTGPEDLVDFDQFFEPGTTSECKKCLTREIWDEYKDQKCAEGVSFKLCVFSGIANQDSGIGVYAGSHDAYTKFNKLFDKVIENYHGHAPGAPHVSDMSADGLENADFTPEQEAMVNSTRIRVGRNLASFPLGPGVTKAQRLEIMNKVIQACNTFEGDLKGKFYPLEGMSKEDQTKLIEDHFLFK